MRKFYFILLLFIAQKVAAQTITIPIKATGDTSDKSVILDDEIKVSITPKKKYRLKISGVNSAHTSLTIKANSKEIYTPLPEVLKTVIPGVTGSAKSKGKGVSDKILDLALKGVAKTKIDKLNDIKEEADALHKATLFIPNTTKASNAYNKISNNYSKAEDDALTDSVRADINYLVALKEIAENAVKLEPPFEREKIKFYSSLISISGQLKENDYLKHFDYISRSRTAKDSLNSKTFSGSKDLVELDIILVDTYAKDTLAKETRTIYTQGGGLKNLGLSFSTGFFYTELLSDQPYYLQAQPDETMEVLPEKRTVSDVSIGALGHVYYKASPTVRFGPAIGISVSPMDGKSRYLGGLSLLVGKEKMVGITAGRAFAKVKELSDAVKRDGEGMYLPKGTTAVPTVDRVDSNWFIGVTYNLLSTRK